MGRLAVIGLKYVHGKPITDADVAWLIHQLQDARQDIEQYEQALGQRGHVIELTDIGWGIEHTVDCRAGGILNCPIHLHMEREFERTEFEDMDDGRYFVELSHDGKLHFTPLEESYAEATETD